MLSNDQAPSRCSWFLSGWRDVGVTGYIRSRSKLVSHRRASHHGTVLGNLCGLGWCVYVSTTGLCHWRWERVDRLELVERPCPRCGLTCKSHKNNNNNLVVVQLLSGFSLFATPWTAACQASLSLSVSWSLPKLMSVESVMLSNHLILCHPPLLLPQSFSASGPFPKSHLFTSGGHGDGKYVYCFLSMLEGPDAMKGFTFYLIF